MRIAGIVLVLMASFSAFGVDGVLDRAFNAGVAWRNGAVNDFARQSTGKIILGGNFSVVDGRSYNCVARLNADGSLDPTFNIGRGAGFNTVGCGGEVRAIAVQADDKILVGGSFVTFGDTGPTEFRSGLARLNPDGSLDASFIGLVPGSGPSGEIDDIAVQPDGKILIGGFNMTAYDGVPVGYFARLNANGTLDSTFNTNLSGGFNNSTRTIELQTDGKILVGGPFTQVGSNAAPRLARLNSNGSFDSAFTVAGGTGLSNGVADIVVQADGKIVIGGVFDTFNGTPANRLVRLNANGSRDASFVSAMTAAQPITALAIDSAGRILAGGMSAYFDDGVVQRNTIARLSSVNGSIDPSFSVEQGTNGLINAIGFQSNDLLVAGGFTVIRGKSQLAFCRLLPTGVVNADFEPVIGTPGTVHAVVVQPDNKILIGGNFYGANSALRQRLTRLNPDGTTDTSFFPGQGEADVDMEVNAIALQPDGKILVGGSFNSFGGVANPGLTRLNPDGSVDGTFSTSTGGVHSIAVQADGKIVIGGLFAAVNGVFGHNRIARLNSDGTIDNTFTATGAPCNCGVEKVLVQPDGKILVGGYFNEFNGVAGMNNLVRLTSTGAIDVPFMTNGGTGFSGTVYDIDIQPSDGKIIATGWFNGYGTFASAGLARLSSSGTFDGSFSVGSGFTGSSPVTTTLQPDGRILVGGYFSGYQNVSRRHIVRILDDGSIDPTFAPVSSPDGGVQGIALQSTKSIVIGGLFSVFGNANGTARFGVARLRNGNLASFRAPFDFDGDGQTDISIFRSSDRTWWLNRSSAGNIVHTFAASTDTPVPADWTGDGITDVATYRASTGTWYILRSEDFTFYAFPLGISTDIAVPGDFDGDGKADAALYRPSLGWWFIQTAAGTIVQPFGASTDKPVVADYDGDSIADVAVYRPASGQWWIRRSSTGTVVVETFGQSTDKPVPGDYTGDGRSDIAVWRPSEGKWYIRRSEDGSFYTIQLGAAGDIPVPGDYDGDGKFDASIFRPPSGTWYTALSFFGSTQITQFGNATDLPLPSSYVR